MSPLEGVASPSGREFHAAAKCGGSDHALFELDTDEWALVHLTWAANRPGWPTVAVMGSWDDVLLAAIDHARLHK